MNHETFMNRAKIPGTMESKIVAESQRKAAEDTQRAVREMLYIMIESVPGQLYRDVARFSSKFGVEPTESPDHALPEDVLNFRLKFMLEELREYAQAVGFELSWGSETGFFFRQTLDPVDTEKAFDGLIDLVYVAVGTAYLHRFNFNKGWSRVQAANMAKERAQSSDDSRSTRKHALDIVKPAGWKPPVLADLLGKTEDCSCSMPGGALKSTLVYGGQEHCELCGGLIVRRG